MSFPVPGNPQNLPQPIVASIDPATGKKVAIVRFRFSDIFGSFAGGGSLTKPYLSLTGNESLSVKYAINQLALGNNFPDFGLIKSLGYTFRPNFEAAGGDSDYANAQTLYMVQSVSKVIVYDAQNSSTAHIEPDQTPTINSDQGSGVGFYLPSAVIVQGAIPFYANPFDTVEVCVLTPSSVTAIGKCELRFYNFDVPVFNRTTYSNFAKLA